ncbi:MAG: ATP-binding protein, partial [bacterium]|nr:ATP-binding protein [bacterium]
KSINIEKKYKADLPKIYFDAIHIKQIVCNILTNAVQAMGEKGRLTIETLYSQEGNILVAFKDNGSGIAPDIADKVFDPFVTTKKKGTGLGLSVVKSIVDTYGGSVNIKNLKPGTEVKISLPIRTVFKNGNRQN